jgi:cell division septum initiation protein DivIVA
MTDKEFKRLTRSQLIDIIYQLQMKEKNLAEENRRLRAEVEDKRIRMSQAGNIAEASLTIFNVVQSVQNAADQYLEEIRRMQEETKENCRMVLEKAQKEAEAIVKQATKKRTDYDMAVESILKEYEQDNR